MADIDDALTRMQQANAFLTPLVGSLSGVDNPLYGVAAIDTCITELVANLANLKSSNFADSSTKKSLLKALAEPFDAAADALRELFVPDPDAFEDEGDFSSYADEYATQVVDALKNPFAAMMQSQSAVFKQFWRHLQKIVSGERGITAKLEYVLQEIFYDSEGAGYKLGSLLLFAIHETVPAIDAELQILREMKRRVRALKEESSKLPPYTAPQLPNIATSNRLCDATEHLRRVAAELRANRTWNRSEFAAATDDVCAAKSTIYSGQIDAITAAQIGQVSGWDARQVEFLARGKFLPDAGFRLALLELDVLNQTLQRHNFAVLAFHVNLQNLIETVESLVALHLADVLALIVDLLRANLEAIRQDLEAQSFGFTSAGRAALPDRLDGTQVISHAKRRRYVPASEQLGVAEDQGEPDPEGQYSRSYKYGSDIYAYLSGQVFAYASLTALCYLMQQVSPLATVLQSMFDANSVAAKIIVDFLNYYSAESCGDADGGRRIEQALQTLSISAKERLEGWTSSNEFVCQRADELIQEIEKHEAWLRCIKSRMVGGSENVARAVSAYAGAVKFSQNLRAMARVADLYEKLRTLDLKRMSTADNALDAVMRSLQCFALNCDNPALGSIALSAWRESQFYRDSQLSRNTGAESFDKEGQVGRGEAMNSRLEAFFKLYRAIESIATLDVEKLCQVKTTKDTTSVPPEQQTAPKKREAKTPATPAPAGDSYTVAENVVPFAGRT